MRISGSALVVFMTVGAVSLSAQQGAGPQQAPATPQPGGSQPPSVTASPGPKGSVVPVPTGRAFAAGAGAIFSPVRPDKVLDFEMVLGRIHEALAQSTDPVRRQQAAGWKVFKATEPGPNGSVLYVFVMDPAVKGADYTVSRILSEAFPTEVQEIYKLWSAAFAGGQSLLNLQVLENFAEPVIPKTPAAAK